MGPKDDCESWFYLLLDLIMPRGLLWKSVPDKNMVRKIKEEMRTIRREAAFYGVKCKTQLMNVMDYLDTLQYQDRVDYEYIYKLLELGAKTAGGNIDLPYDWEIGDDPTQSMTGDEKPHAQKPKKKSKRKGTNVSPNRSQQAQVKQPDSVNAVPGDNLSKEKQQRAGPDNGKESRGQKSTSGGRKTNASRADKGFFMVNAPKRQLPTKTKSTMGEPSSMSTAASSVVRQTNTRRPVRRARPRRRKKQTSSSSSSAERSAGGKNVSGHGKVTSQSTGTSGGKKLEKHRGNSSKTGEEASTQSCRSARMHRITGKSPCSRSTNKRKGVQRNTKQSVKKGDVSL
ncbi:hypothetical protein TELCIR_14487 [Teladorsagia circumcincta]|uniref:Uncharacterized protein n=1 Tax=Teladorsagia circumcincta TaxID=45464 RepID=A0A2G9U315_TELCI|nr:hypothetical protein TELCIR_14487 [Teladorsagia circumcincta]